MAHGAYIDELIRIADSVPYADFCRLLRIIYWNL